MLVFKIEIVNHIFENEKLNLNLNSMRWKKDKGPEYYYDIIVQVSVVKKNVWAQL